MKGKRPEVSQVTLHHFTLPQHANPLGPIYGGVTIKPIQIPSLILKTDEERRHWAEGQVRQQRRLEHQAQGAADQ